jgi:hypothetical protein
VKGLFSGYAALAGQSLATRPGSAWPCVFLYELAVGNGHVLAAGFHNIFQPGF